LYNRGVSTRSASDYHRAVGKRQNAGRKSTGVVC